MQPRMPQGTQLHTLDENFEALLVDACQKLIKAAPIRRVRRIAGLLREFRDASNDEVMTIWYQRVVETALREALDERG